MIQEGSSDIKEKFEVLLRGDTIQTSVDEQIVYNQLDDNEEGIWSLLVASGYLKILSYEQPKRFYHGFVLGLIVDLLSVGRKS